MVRRRHSGVLYKTRNARVTTHNTQYSMCIIRHIARGHFAPRTKDNDESVRARSTTNQKGY